MDPKQVLGFILTIGGMAALIYGVVNVFSGGMAGDGGSWAALILGLVFFFAGIGLVKSPKSTT